MPAGETDLPAGLPSAAFLKLQTRGLGFASNELTV